MRYAPESYLADPVLRRSLAALDPRQRAAFAENLCGSIKNHVFYAVRAARDAATVASFSLEAIPVLRELDGATLARGFRPGVNMTADLGGHRVSLPLPPLAGAILERIDGQRSFAEIGAALPPASDFAAQAEALYRTMNGLNRMLLRAGADRR
jgi:hypothetical protein